MAPRAAARLESLGYKEVYEYKAGKSDWMAAGLPTEGSNAEHPRAGDVARKDAPTATLAERLGDVRERVRAAGFAAVVVIDDERVVLGLLRAKELGKDPELVIEDAMRPGPSTFRPHVTMDRMVKHMVEHNLENSPITTGDGKLVGLLLRSDAERELASRDEKR